MYEICQQHKAAVVCFSKTLLHFGSAILERYPYLIAWQGQKQLQRDSKNAYCVVGYATQL